MKIKLLLIAFLSAIVMGVMPSVAQALPATGPWYQPKVGDQNPLVFAHQGGEGEYPSNVKLAFTQAHNGGADTLDTDMLATSDGQLVLYHDETLDFRSNCTGLVSAMSYNDLYQNCNIAYDWSPDGGTTFPYRNSTDPNATKIVKVSELLDAFPNDRISIEIKQTTVAMSQALCTLITQKNATGRVLVSSGESGSQPNMNAFRTACPTVATSATGGETLTFLQHVINNDFPSDYGTNPALTPFSSIQPPMSIVNSNFVTKAHQYQLKVYAWTIDTPEQSQPLIDAGVDGLNTSYPARILTWMNGAPARVLAQGPQQAFATPDHCAVSLMHGNFGTTAFSQFSYQPNFVSNPPVACDENSYVVALSLTANNANPNGTRKWAAQRCHIGLNLGDFGDGGCGRWGSSPGWYQSYVATSTIVGTQLHLCGEFVPCDTYSDIANNPRYSAAAPTQAHGVQTTLSKGQCTVSFMHGGFSTTAYSQMKYSPASGGCNPATSFIELAAIDAVGNLNVQRCFLNGGFSGTGNCATWDDSNPLYDWFQANYPNRHIVGSTVRLCDDNVQDPCDDFYYTGF